MKVYRQVILPVSEIAFTLAIFLAALSATKFIHLPPGSFIPLPSVMQAIYLVFCVAAMLLISRGRLAIFGFTRGTYKFGPRIFLWVLPMAALSTAVALASRGGHTVAGPASGFTKLQIIVFIWIFSSICEEILVRGLLQTLLSRTAAIGSETRRWLSMPVVVSGLFFGAMHLVLVKQMGPKAFPVILTATFLGLVAARYREKTGSLLPAIIVHALFNIGGTLPLWAIIWLRGSL